MADKPKKSSNLTNAVFEDERSLKQYIVDLDRDVFNLFTYLDTFPRFFEQSSEPTIQRNTYGYWSNTATASLFALCNISGGQKKVELL